MSWIKEANKIGKYWRTYYGFRIYCTKEMEIKETIVERKGEKWKQTDFIPGWLVAIDKYGVRFEKSNMEELAFKIDMELMARRFDKREAKYEKKQNEREFRKNNKTGGWTQMHCL